MKTAIKETKPARKGKWRSWFAVLTMTAILACLVTFDLFTHPDRSITFDGRVHISTIAVYHDLMANRVLPTVWVDHWGNYGYPLGLISYQVTSYLGGLIQFISGSPVVAYNVLFWLATFFSGVMMYVWVRHHGFSVQAAVLAEVLFMFAPYHLQNIYVRGALPEYVASMFVLMVLLGARRVILRARYGHSLIMIGVALIMLTHPMTLVTGGILIVMYTLLLVAVERVSFMTLASMAISGAFGLIVSMYYTLPLFTQIKYFHYGLMADKFRTGQFPSLGELFSPFAPYFGTSHPGPPGVALRLGTIESLTLAMVGILGLLGKLKKHVFILGVFAITGILMVFVLPPSAPLYQHLSIFNNLQYPWRFLSAISIVIPMLAAFLFHKYSNLPLYIIAVSLVMLIGVQQAYGKNFVFTPNNEYQFTVSNLHTKNMAPIWAGESSEYPFHPEKIGIIDGTAQISSLRITNGTREFDVDARTPLLMVDYTFFFPGWKVYVDGNEVPIEFQDVRFRGVITYRVPEGKHHVSVTFIPTRDRKWGWLLSGVGILVVLAWFRFIRGTN